MVSKYQTRRFNFALFFLMCAHAAGAGACQFSGTVDDPLQFHRELVRALKLNDVNCRHDIQIKNPAIGCAKREGSDYGTTRLQTFRNTAEAGNELNWPAGTPIIIVGVRWYLPRRKTFDWRATKNTVPDSIVDHITSLLMPGDKAVNSKFKELIRKARWSHTDKYCASGGLSENKQVELVISVAQPVNGK